MLTNSPDFSEVFSTPLSISPGFSNPDFLKRLENSLPLWLKLVFFCRNTALVPLGYRRVALNQFEFGDCSSDQMEATFSDRYFTVKLKLQWSPKDKKLYLFSNGFFHRVLGRSYFYLTKPAHNRIFQTLVDHIARTSNER